MPVEDFKEHLELTTRIGCKSMCKYCPQDVFIKRYFEVWDTSFKPLELTLDNCIKYVESVPKDLKISLAGFSEPLSCSEIKEIYRYLLRDGRHVDVNTSLYDVEMSVLQDIVETGVEFINIHVPDKNNYTNIQINRDYIKKLRFLLSHFENTDTDVVITCLGDIPPVLNGIINEYGCIIGKNIGRQFMNDRAGIVKNGLPYKSNNHHGKIHCCKTLKSLNYTVLLPDGTVVLCCMDFGLTHILGNIRQNTYTEILHGDMANEIRRKMDIEGSEIICRRCEFAVSEELV